MQLKKPNRKQLMYATAVVVLTGGVIYGVKQSSIETLAANRRPAIQASLSGEGKEPAKEDAVAPVEKAVTPTEEDKPRAKTQEYTVVAGDTVGAIAEKFGLKSTTIRWANDISGDHLDIGQKLVIPSEDGLVYKVNDGDTISEIAAATGAKMDEILRANPEISPDTVQPGDTILVPGGEPPVRRQVVSRSSSRARTTSAPAPAPVASVAPGAKLSQWPLSGLVTDNFGWRTHPVRGTWHLHDGMDIAAPYGSTVRAAAGGTVSYVGWNGGYGFEVRINHGSGLQTRYAHLTESYVVQTGQQVGAGTAIGYVGTTGATTGAHLHFMVLKNGTPNDPRSWLP